MLSSNLFRLFTITVSTLVLSYGCGPSEKAGTSDSGNGPRSCTSTIDCLITDQVCDPDTQLCTDFVPCTNDSECGPAAFCSNGLCAVAETGSPCIDNSNCLPGEDCFNGLCGCDGELFEAEAIAPNIMIVLDRSGSMRDQNGKTKWTDAKNAVSQITSQFSQEAQFGLLMFPTPGQGNCDVTQAQVLPTINSGSAIAASMNAAPPIGDTPLYQAVDFVKTNRYLEDTTRDNIMILVADGDQSCVIPGGGTKLEIIALASDMAVANPPVKTFTIGYQFNNGFSFLSSIAEAGGTQTVYEASNAAGLTSALNSIVGSVLSCTYEISAPSSDTTGVVVYVDGNEATEDPDNGYTYDPNTNRILFHGQMCSNLQNGTSSEVQVLTGCSAGPG